VGRKRGSHNADFEATRSRLLELLGERLGEPDGVGASLRELAEAAGVSTATVRHYFKDRAALIEAYLEHCNRLGARYLLMVAMDPLQDSAKASLRWTLDQIHIGLARSALGKMHALGLRAGLESPGLGPAYLRTLLEPTLRCVEVRIERHQARGELVGRDPRLLALALVSPLLLAMLHQRSLFGCDLRPLDVGALVESLVDSIGE
jgi:AcrR family transcriptional regulator